MHVDNRVHTIVGSLKVNKLGDGTKIVAQMQVARWLNAGENAWLETGHLEILVMLPRRLETRGGGKKDAARSHIPRQLSAAGSVRPVGYRTRKKRMQVNSCRRHWLVTKTCG
jgi:hypothetical protein